MSLELNLRLLFRNPESRLMWRSKDFQVFEIHCMCTNTCNETPQTLTADRHTCRSHKQTSTHRQQCKNTQIQYKHTVV